MRRAYGYRTRKVPYGAAGARTGKDYYAAQQSKAMVVTRCRTNNSANRVGGNGLNRISVGRYRDLPTLWPDRFMCKLKGEVSYDNNLGPNQYSYIIPFTPTAVDSTLHYGSIAGYNELAALYGTYVVHAFNTTAQITFDGAPATAVLATLGYSATPLPFTSATTHAQLMAATGNPYVVYGLIAQYTNEPMTLINYCSTRKVKGNSNVGKENAFSASTAGLAEPTDSVEAWISVSVPTPLTAAIPFHAAVQIEYYIEFYNRTFMSS